MPSHVVPQPFSATDESIGSRPEIDLAHKVIEFLRTEPTPMGFAQELVLRFLRPFDARAAIVSVIASDATLHTVGTFGLPHDVVASVGDCSVWDGLPAAAAVRSHQAVVVPLAEDVPQRFPELSAHGITGKAVVAVPLLTSASMVGALCVCFESEGPAVLEAARMLQPIADVYVLYLASAGIEEAASTTMPATKGGRAGHDRGASAGRPASRADFTQRQLQVLQLLSEGLTYDQIASRIGYSHSTVREELIQVYRRLGVRSRREATDAAARLGMVNVFPAEDGSDRGLREGREPATR